jgi:tetratricopeptide (TPR) repeat protein
VRVNHLLIALLAVLIAINASAAATNSPAQAPGVTNKEPDPNDPIEKEFKKLMDEDDAAEAEIDGWILENQEFAKHGAALPARQLNQRIRKRFEPVQKGYEDFIKRHPNHARVRIAYAGLLEDLGDEEGEIEQLKKARELDPTIPSVHNQLGNYFGHSGELTNAFISYEKAIALDPSEPVYYDNFATTIYLFRKDASAHYQITEQQVFDKALDLYTKAVKLDPTNFALATKLAESYYGIRPVRTEDALISWTNALKLASNSVEREGVYLHLARFKMNAGRFDDARSQLAAVTNEAYSTLKARLTRTMQEREKAAKETNSPPADVSTNAVKLDSPAGTGGGNQATNRGAGLK